MIINKDYTGIVEEISFDNVEGLQTALNLKSNLESPTFTGTVAGIDKNMVGLGNVDNTADADKVISNLTQTALNLKASETDLHDVSIEVTSNMDEIALKSNLASPIFSGTVKIEKADNYGQIELTDLKSVAMGVGGGITFNGVYGGAGQQTGLANIKRLIIDNIIYI